ncbi:hypothetical protein ACFWBF_13915 [Streptomyces sp. NPDC060028]|uniref:hypothetical protein n=1 Tax=Streptomyces sp. NPDC060028 TaxID=3347041 RepID=UPI0036CBFC4B
MTRDRDGSGREIRLFDRPDLGPWLKKPDLYDGIAVQKMDRLTRRPVDSYLFFEWCKEHANPGGEEGAVRGWVYWRPNESRNSDAIPGCFTVCSVLLSIVVSSSATAAPPPLPAFLDWP